ncbi:MAG: ribonuclease HI, partial [Ruminococcus flavefaciens]|nr:ribonuclease HI [Ruminococcus flavefaciens]
MFEIYTDGSCKGNPGPGGCGVIVCVRWGDEPEEALCPVNGFQEFEEHTTNNRQELKAIIWALENYGNPKVWFENPSCIPRVYTDSAYCVNSITKWMPGWKANDWRKANKKPVENLDLIQKIDDLFISGYRIDLRKVEGHANCYWNNIVDKLATGKTKLEDLDIEWER